MLCSDTLLFLKNFRFLNRILTLSETSFELELEDEKLAKYEYLGLLLMDVTLMPKHNLEEKEQVFLALRVALLERFFLFENSFK